MNRHLDEDADGDGAVADADGAAAGADVVGVRDGAVDGVADDDRWGDQSQLHWGLQLAIWVHRHPPSPLVLSAFVEIHF